MDLMAGKRARSRGTLTATPTRTRELLERGKLQGITGEPARKDARDKDDPIRQEREGARGLVGLSQAVWSQREEEKSVTDLAST
jgi:hypothetical protein